MLRALGSSFLLRMLESIKSSDCEGDRYIEQRYSTVFMAY